LKRLSIPIAAAVILIVGFVGFSALNSPTGGTAEGSFTLKTGDGAKKVASNLQRGGYIRSRVFFYALVRMSGKDRSLKSGEYRLDGSMSTIDVLKVLGRGVVVTERFTVPEGLNLRQVADLLEGEGLITAEAFLRAASDKKLIEKYGIPFETAEGFLYPETYVVAKGYSAYQLADLMVAKFFDSLAGINFTGYSKEDLRKVVTIASLVEREAKLDQERPLVSAVFYNRLRTGKRLESCATVQYALEKPKERLLYSDLKVQSPYNTYLHNGLPPGPIANPGIKSIIAAIRPADVDYLFFVLKTDGSHFFSASYGEHLRAIKRYNPSGRVGHQLS
jgi:UPF0755 protein